MSAAEDTLREIEALLPLSSEPNIVERVRALLPTARPTAEVPPPRGPFKAKPRDPSRATFAPALEWAAAMQAAMNASAATPGGSARGMLTTIREHFLAAIHGIQKAHGLTPVVPDIHLTRDTEDRIYMHPLVEEWSEAHAWTRLVAWMNGVPFADVSCRRVDHGVDLVSVEVVLLPPSIHVGAIERACAKPEEGAQP